MLNLESALFRDRRSKGGFKPFDLTLGLLCASIKVYIFRLEFYIFTWGGHLVFGASFV